MQQNETTKISMNLDTNFLKFIAIICMAVDHFSKAFWPDNIFLAIVGRIAFPLFAYCLVVGCLHTKNMNRYLLRLFVFALISQPFCVMAFHPTWDGFIENILVLNIFFTLLAGVMIVAALMNIKKRWWLIVIAIAMEVFLGLDYGFYGLIMIVLFYVFRQRRWLAISTVCLLMILNGLGGDFVSLFGIGLDRQIFALLALPLIGLHTHVYPKINKYFFYIFYPAHFLVLFILERIVMGL